MQPSYDTDLYLEGEMPEHSSHNVPYITSRPDTGLHRQQDNSTLSGHHGGGLAVLYTILVGLIIRTARYFNG